MQFVSNHCVGCSACVEVCQPAALHKAPFVDASPERKPVVLKGAVKQRCGRCDRFFISPTAEDVCPVCRDDDDAFGRIFA